MAVDVIPKLPPPAAHRKRREQGAAGAAGGAFPQPPSGPSSPSNGVPVASAAGAAAANSSGKDFFDSLLDLDMSGGFAAAGAAQPPQSTNPQVPAGAQPNYGALSGFSMTNQYPQPPQHQQQRMGGAVPPQALFNPAAASNPFASPTGAYPPPGMMQSPGMSNPFGMPAANGYGQGQQQQQQMGGYGNGMQQQQPAGFGGKVGSPMQGGSSGFDADFGSVFGGGAQQQQSQNNNNSHNPFGMTPTKAGPPPPGAGQSQASAQSKLIQGDVNNSLANLAANLNLGSLGAYGVRPTSVAGSNSGQIPVGMAGMPQQPRMGMAPSTMNSNPFGNMPPQQQQQNQFGGMGAGASAGWSNPFMSPTGPPPQASPSRGPGVTAASDDPFASLI